MTAAEMMAVGVVGVMMMMWFMKVAVAVRVRVVLLLLVINADVGGDGALVRMPMTQCTMQNIITAQTCSRKLVESRGEMKSDVMPIWP